jgi:hypothetical protein
MPLAYQLPIVSYATTVKRKILDFAAKVIKIKREKNLM